MAFSSNHSRTLCHSVSKDFQRHLPECILCILLFANGTYATSLEQQAGVTDYYDTVSLLYLTIVALFLESFYRYKHRYVAFVDDFLFYVSASVFWLVHLCLYDCWHWSKLLIIVVYIGVFFIAKVCGGDNKDDDKDILLVKVFWILGYGALFSFQTQR